ncbi:PP2C family serine/threonine-protein phosphatase [Variovorax sp. KK3]|uniref:PP2C family protein-serine/threonine phosphatase n=1 Tax=Variovorax sp. KK3 TaxID=1855728 RepID=UPI0015C31E67|nr:PP2C family serine/threonine-protein phosphatase [Variovorax sp. KK3]
MSAAYDLKSASEGFNINLIARTLMDSTHHIQKQLTGWFMRRTASSGVRRVSALAAAVATEVGSVRADNQDRVAVARGWDKDGRPFAVAAVADGIGGMQDGALCAAMALAGLFAEVAEQARAGSPFHEWLPRAVDVANVAVHAKFRGDGGSTLVAALMGADGKVAWTNIGDSRVYHQLAGKLVRLSTDDTIAGQLGKGREAGPDQSKLLQFIGIGNPIEPGLGMIDSPAGQVLLASDGVHFLDSTPWFEAIIAYAPDPGVCVRRLTDLSKACGGHDNASACVMGLALDAQEREPEFSSALEIWDPFGDLQIIVSQTPAIAAAKPSSIEPFDARHPAPPAMASVEPALPDAVEAPAPSATPFASEKSQKKPRKTNGPKKTKPSNNRKSAEEDGAHALPDEPPLFVMEFQSKQK